MFVELENKEYAVRLNRTPLLAALDRMKKNWRLQVAVLDGNQYYNRNQPAQLTTDGSQR